MGEATRQLLLSSPTELLLLPHPTPLHSINCHLKQHSHLPLHAPLIYGGKKSKENPKRAWVQAFAAERKDAYKWGYEKS